VFLQLRWIGLCETKWDFLYLETVISRKYFFQKLTQFSQGNNVIHAAASNTHSFLSKDICVSSSHLNRPLMNKVSLSPPWKLWFPGSIHSKKLLSCHRETMCYMLQLLIHMVLFGEIHVFLQLRWIFLFGKNRAYLPLKQLSGRKYYFQKQPPFSQ
jgi:hypothetical protein